MKTQNINVDSPADFNLQEKTSQSRTTNVTLDEVIESSYSKHSSIGEKYFGVLTAELAYDSKQKIFFIEHPFNKSYLIPITKSLISINPNDAGQEILVSFEHGILSLPVITGKIQALSHELNDIEVELPVGNDIGLSVDKKDELIFKAEKEIVFKCGKSSITLTKAGKVLIRGAYILSRSTGANQLKGGSVQLN